MSKANNYESLQIEEFEIQALDEIELALTQGDALKKACELYNKLKSYIPTVITLVGKIPRIGKTIASLIQALQTIADLACVISVESTLASKIAEVTPSN